jgi:hypothetical protein
MLGGSGNGAGGNVGFGEGLAGELLRVHALKPLIDEILVQSGFKPGDDPVKALAGVVLPNGESKVEAKGDVKGEAKANLLKANVVNDKPLPSATPQV